MKKRGIVLTKDIKCTETTDKDIRKFANSLNSDLTTVSKSIVEELRIQGFHDSNYTIRDKKYYINLFKDNNDVSFKLSKNNYDQELNINSIINISINNNNRNTEWDKVVKALENFFSNAAAVTGFLVTSILLIVISGITFYQVFLKKHK